MQWSTLGLAIGEDDRNFWQVAFVATPTNNGSRVRCELVEMRDGVWQANRNDGLRCDFQRGTGGWEFGKEYSLSISLDENRVRGSVMDSAGGLVFESEFSFSDKPAVRSGRPGMRANGGFCGVIRNPCAEMADALPPRVASEEAFPPYESGSFAPEIRDVATGFFHMAEKGGKWWVIDPLGRGTVLLGVDHVSYNGFRSQRTKRSMYREWNDAHYSDREAWIDETVGRLKSWGFNMLGAGGHATLEHRGLIHTRFLSMGDALCKDEQDDEFWICPNNHRPCSAFPNVFHPLFAAHCDYVARRKCAPLKNDPWLFGYFIDNELAWWGRGAARTGLFDAAMKRPDSHHAKKALLKFVAAETTRRGLAGTPWEKMPSAVRDEIKYAFLGLAAEKYFSVTSAAIRRHDPNHLVLGARFAGLGSAGDAPVVWEVAGKYCDVVTFNCYPWADLDRNVVLLSDARGAPRVSDAFAERYAIVKRPMLVTEWSFPALDSGLPCTAGAGQRVRTQKERASASELYAKTMLSLPFLVGYDYFMWVDEPAAGISDSFPEDCNYGLVNERGEPYPELTSMFSRLQNDIGRWRAAPLPAERNVSSHYGILAAEIRSGEYAMSANATFTEKGPCAGHVANAAGLVLDYGNRPKERGIAVSLDGRVIGDYCAMLHFATQDGGEKWVDAPHVASAEWLDGSLLVVFESRSGGSEFSIAQRITPSPDKARFLAELVEVRNLGKNPIEVKNFYFRAYAPYAGEAKAAKCVPRLWKAKSRLASAWMANDGRWFGLASSAPAASICNFVWNKTRQSQLPDAICECEDFLLAPGGTYRPVDGEMWYEAVCGLDGDDGWRRTIYPDLSAPVWQLGVADGSDAEFGLRNYCGEYSFQNETGFCVRKSKYVDHTTKTFRYAVPGNGVFEKVPLPREISSPCFERWLDEDQLVTGLELSWNESEPGPRVLKVNVAGHSNQEGFGRRGIEFDLPCGGFYSYTLPAGEKNSPDGKLTIAVPLEVRAGRNAVTIRNVAPVLYHRLVFDSIVLEKPEEPIPLPRILQIKTDAFSNITHPGRPIALDIRSRNVASGNVAWSVQDVWSNVVARGTAKLAGGCASVALPVGSRGWFSVSCACEEASDETTYVVIEPPEDRVIPDSRFGCHAFVCDRYRLADTPFSRTYVETKMRRAYLAGAKRARYHWVSWMLREPEPGRYMFDDLDRYLTLGEKHFMTPFLDIAQVPQWNTMAPEKTKLVWGAPEFSFHPPKDQKPWGDFMTALAKYCRGRVKEYEIGNEPSYGSIYWHSGDPVAFGKYLMTAYRAIHAVDPAAIVYPGAPMQVAFMEQVCASLKDEKCFDKLSIHYLGNENRLSAKTENWRRFAQSHGYPGELVNSEDMNWVVRRRREPRLGVAADLVKIYVRDAVRGVSCTYGFEMFAGLSWLYPFFGSDDAPRPEYAAYRTMTHRLERAKYVGDLSTRLAEAYVFDRKGTPVVVCWSDGGHASEIDLPLGTVAFTCVDSMDNETTLHAGSGGRVRVPVADNAVFVEGGDWKAIRSAIAAHSDPMAVAASNRLGENLVPEKVRTTIPGKRGSWYNMTGRGVQVGYGERYLLSAAIRGDGTLDGYYEVRDESGKRIFPKRDGLNCLEARAETDRWTTVSQVVTIREPDSRMMTVQLVPNFRKEYAESRIEIKDVVIARIDDAVGPTKALRRGERAVAEGPGGRKATAAARFVDDEIIVGFKLEGGIGVDEPIRFAIDPYNQSKDATVCEIRGNSLYKVHNYVTPELPTGVCVSGVVPEAKVDRRDKGGCIKVHVRLPVRQLYPLKSGQEEVAFDFRIGDTAWSGGIGATLEPSLLGVLFVE